MNMNKVNFDMENLPDDPAELKKIILAYSTELTELKNDNIKLSETVKLYRFKLFGKKSENLPKIDHPGLCR